MKAPMYGPAHAPVATAFSALAAIECEARIVRIEVIVIARIFASFLVLYEELAYYHFYHISNGCQIISLA